MEKKPEWIFAGGAVDPIEITIAKDISIISNIVEIIRELYSQTELTNGIGTENRE